MLELQADALEILVIGFGNIQRRDDGIGPYVIRRLKDEIGLSGNIKLLDLSQLTLELVEELYSADTVIFVDATIEVLETGWKCEKMPPPARLADFQTHHLRPGFLLNLLQALYHRNPPAWMIAVQGEDFGFGLGITPAARERAEKVIEEITSALRELDSIQTRNTDNRSGALWNTLIN